MLETTSRVTRLMVISIDMPKGYPKNGVNKGWFKEGNSFWEGKKRLDMIGNKFSEGKTPWNKGIEGYHLPKRDNPTDEKAFHWRGDNVRYQGLHGWMRRKFGRAVRCELCGEDRPRHVHWANISHQYKRDRNDFIQLCVKHHIAYDKGLLKL